MNTLPVTHFRPRLSAFIQFADRHASAFVPIWALVYIAAILPDAGRPLWFDELITYYVSNAPSLHRLFEMINHVDLNPPLSYLAMRTCLAALGGGGGDCAIDIDGVLLRRRCVAV